MVELTCGTANLVDLEGYHVINKRRYEKTLLERRLMAAFIIVAVFSILCLFVSVMTSSWVIIDHVHSGNVTTKFRIGIWGEWRIDYNNSKTTSKWIRHFPTTPKNNYRLKDSDLPHYYRTQAVFSAITLVLMVTSISFALYSFEHHRYMFKRLTAGLFVFVSMCILIVIEVLLQSIREWGPINDVPLPQILADEIDTPSSEVTPHDPDDYYSKLKYGYSIWLAWVIFGTYLIGALIFLLASRKQKGNRAATQEFEVEDRPINLGRF